MLQRVEVESKMFNHFYFDTILVILPLLIMEIL